MTSSFQKLFTGAALNQAQANAVFEEMLEGKLSDIEISAVLTAMKVRKESGLEIATLVNILRERAVKVEKPDVICADCAGTGGDGLGTFNVSTAAALTATACGVPMMKHGNRASSSPSGSADIIEKMGYNLALTAAQIRTVFDATGFAFLFAPAFHPLVGRVMPVRKTLATATIFNLAGPLANPVAPEIQLMGVCDEALLQPMAEVLQRIGCQKGLVVFGSGLDEVAIHADTKAMFVTPDEISPLDLSVADFGVKTQHLSSIQLGNDDPVKVFEDVINGQADDAKTAMVGINTAAILWLADKANDLKQATEMAISALREGRVKKQLDNVVSLVRQL